MRAPRLRAAAILAGCLGAGALLLAGRTDAMPLCAATTCLALIASDSLEEAPCEVRDDE